MASDTRALGTDSPLLDALRNDLTSASFTVETVEALIGPAAAQALRREDPAPARHALRCRIERAAGLFRLFVLGDALGSDRIEALLPELGVEGACDLCLLESGPSHHSRTSRDDSDDSADVRFDTGPIPVHDPLRARITLSPYSATDDAGDIHWWIASDLAELATGRPLGAEHVLGVGGASLTLARITPRDPVATALDVGCGGGIQALHLSRHAERVVATDLSQRALDFAAFNAALNGITLDLRRGSLLEPIGSERFDLIVSNPPFVITPRDSAIETWTYRDGGRAGDAIVGDMLRALPAHLAPGGSAVMLGNWEISGEDWSAHPRTWLETAQADGVDAWVIQRDREDPAAYAATWARDGGITPRDAAWDPLIMAWLNDFASRGVDGIGFGYVLLHRPAGPGDHTPSRAAVLRCEEAVGTGSGTLAEHLAATMQRLSALAALEDEQLGATRPIRADDVMERRHLVPGAWDPTLIELVQGGGLARTQVADQVLAATVGALDGTLTLEQTLAAVCALTGDDLDEARGRVFAQVRELIVAGMLTI